MAADYLHIQTTNDLMPKCTQKITCEKPFTTNDSGRNMKKNMSQQQQTINVLLSRLNWFDCISLSLRIERGKW